jgi:hypothetical protein
MTLACITIAHKLQVVWKCGVECVHIWCACCVLLLHTDHRLSRGMATCVQMLLNKKGQMLSRGMHAIQHSRQNMLLTMTLLHVSTSFTYHAHRNAANDAVVCTDTLVLLSLLLHCCYPGDVCRRLWKVGPPENRGWGSCIEHPSAAQMHKQTSPMSKQQQRLVHGCHACEIIPM